MAQEQNSFSITIRIFLSRNFIQSALIFENVKHSWQANQEHFLFFPSHPSSLMLSTKLYGLLWFVTYEAQVTVSIDIISSTDFATTTREKINWANFTVDANLLTMVNKLNLPAYRTSNYRTTRFVRTLKN